MDLCPSLEWWVYIGDNLLTYFSGIPANQWTYNEFESTQNSTGSDTT